MYEVRCNNNAPISTVYHKTLSGVLHEMSGKGGQTATMVRVLMLID
ncbi:hypothetical protein BH09BAC1_BH09BAC1_02790 [soil metagenome]